ncbi:hypothetical protein [Lacinutrix jangbogonensis]|uniref:hypothetical protein n=1 Tax=Lacinutrix jangbogonensis TaxID=1469557 RepID=UPI00053F0AA0|nr:hypothetical protein [Lacinutrix jangbogonensis]
MDIENIKRNTAVTPISEGGSNFETHVLYKKTNNKFLIKPSIGLALFTSAFTLFSTCFTSFPLYSLITSNTDKWEFNQIWFVGFGLLFFCFSLYLLFNYFSPHGFDKTTNLYYRGYKNISSKTDAIIKLNNIVALQIIGETIIDEDSRFKSFELNIVLKNGDRINVVDHSNLSGIIDDSKTLSKFLSIPIWHAESNKA